VNRVLLEKLWYLLSNASLDKVFWAEAIDHTSHLLNRLLTTAIGDKTPLDIWSGRAARDYGSLRIFSCSTYIDVKKDILDSKMNKLVFLRYKEDLKGYKLWDPKNKEFVSSRHVILDEASMVKPTISQQVETMKTKLEVSHRVDVDTTPHCPVGSVLSGIPSVVTPSGDRVADMDIEHVEKDGSYAVKVTKGNSRRWVIKKHVSHVYEVHMLSQLGSLLQKRELVELGGAHLNELHEA